MYWFIQASRQQFIFISIFKNALLQTTFNSYYIIFGKEMFHLNLYWVWFNIVLVWFFIKHRFFFSIEIAFSSSFVFDRDSCLIELGSASRPRPDTASVCVQDETPAPANGPGHHCSPQFKLLQCSAAFHNFTGKSYRS